MSSASRRGALVPVVLAVMVLIGLAASAALYMAREERTASGNARLRTAVISGADEAVLVALASMAPEASRLRAGGSRSAAVPVTNAGTLATARLTRLGATTFALMIAARAEDVGGRIARRGSSVLLRLRPARVGFPAALVLAPSGEAPAGIADGRDRAPDGWECMTDSGSVPDTLHPSSRAIDSLELAGLRDRAAVRLPPGAAVFAPQPAIRDDDCDTAGPGNWGDPTHTTPCATWFPIVHAAGDLRVSGGRGQGVLVVDGDLEASGGFEFAGAVIVAGRLTVGPGGARLEGGVRASDVVDADGAAGAGAPITRSSCALNAALLAAGTLAPFAHRAWGSDR